MTSGLLTDLGVAFDDTPFRSSLFNHMDKLYLANESGGDVVTGDVMSLDLSNDESFVNASSSAPYLPCLVVPADIGATGLATTKTILDTESDWLFRPGAYVPLASVDGAVAVGEYLAYSATAKKFTGTDAISGTSYPPMHAKAVALAAATAAGQIPVLLLEETGHQYMACRVYRSTDQSITASTVTAVSFDSETSDPDGMHESVTNPTRVTVPSTFIGTQPFTICGNVTWSGAPAGAYISLRLNGTTEIARERGENPLSWSISTEYELSADDYIELLVYTTTGSLSIKYYDAYSPVLSVVGGG